MKTILKDIASKATTGILILLVVIALLVVAYSCDYDYFPQPPPPPVAEETTTLEAHFVKSAPTSLNNSYWKTADYLKVALTDISTANLYPPGFLNMTGTYNGLSSFNKGKTTALTLKAAYDDNYIYILAEWQDENLHLSKGSWLWNGPPDPRKSEPTDGWTRQRNSDGLAFAFEIDSAFGNSGSFTTLGCAASCHGGKMQTQLGKVDIWNWNLAYTDPMGFAADLLANSSAGLSDDQGKSIYAVNQNGAGPKYEWSGEQQTITKANGAVTILDPAYFLVKTNDFKGDPAKGLTIFSNHCASCHGVNGEGDIGPAFIYPGTNRLSRQAFIDFAKSSNHQGYTYFAKVDTSEYADLLAAIRGFSGVPGNVIQTPDGSNADITAISNQTLAKVTSTSGNTGYKVLLIRKLNTDNADDVKFEPTMVKQYIFGVALMDNDGVNHIGSMKQTLTFK